MLIMLTLALSFLDDSCFPPVVAEDRFRFAANRMPLVYQDWQWLEAHKRLMLDRKEWRFDPAFDWGLWSEQVEFVRLCWFHLDDVFCYDDADLKVKHVARLRNRLGWADYYAGRMPSLERFKQLELDLGITRE